MNSIYNILMYSHDTFGLGHIRRAMAIASHLQGPDINILIVTGSPIAGRFTFPNQVDFVRIPGMIKQSNEAYRPLAIKIDAQQALSIRTNIITATAKTFKPQLFIVDKEPLGLKNEILPTLHWFRKCNPNGRTILGLRDILDDAEVIRQDWTDKGVYRVLQDFYDEIWIYGIADFYDPIREYSFPASLVDRVTFTGYIPRQHPDTKAVRKAKKKALLANGEKLVVVTAGGGGDGFKVFDNYLTMLETESPRFLFKSVLITGPFMPKKERNAIFERARKLGIRAWQFYPRMEEVMAAADLVVCMGGYNTVCEILDLNTLPLIIPRETPRKEQLIRAQVLKNQNMVEYIPWKDLTPRILRRKILELLEDPGPYHEAISRFRLTGLEVMRQRINTFRESQA